MASRKQRGGRSGSEGYVLLVFSLFAALLVIGVYRILPAYRFQGQRMKEEELIFRGQEYRRAIQLFVRKFGRYPTSLEELENTNEIRFIRKLYPDPMTEDGQWRLVHIGPDGVLYDSVHVTKPAGSSSDSEREERTEPDPFGPSGNAEGRDESGEEPATRANASPGTNPGMQPRASGALQQPRLFGGGGIAGVASKNEGEAIKVFNNYKHYNEWEFVFDISTDRIAQDTVKRLFGGGQPTPGSGGAGEQTPPLTPPPGGRGPATPGVGLPGFGQPGPGFRPFPGVPAQPGSGPAPGTVPPTWNLPRQPTTDPFTQR